MFWVSNIPALLQALCITLPKKILCIKEMKYWNPKLAVIIIIYFVSFYFIFSSKNLNDLNSPDRTKCRPKGPGSETSLNISRRFQYFLVLMDFIRMYYSYSSYSVPTYLISLPWNFMNIHSYSDVWF